ncbi:MAG TPA: TonB family protein [Terriglobales bacterium]|nr:TonB family protein [Terriglobales bacterium]
MAEAQPNAPALAQELASIAARAQTYTGASGSAIALSEGDVTEMICRASSGPAAPDVGAAISLEGTFSGMAVQSGQALRCDDSDTDSRVDAAACRALGTRSIVIVPIRDVDTEQVSGVLAVFAGNKNAFNDLHVAVLRTMAREVAVAVQKSRKAGISIGEATGVISAYRPPSNPGFTPPSLTPPVSASKPGPVPVPAASAAAAPKPAPELAPTVMTPAPKLAPPAPPPSKKADAHEPLPMAAPVVPTKKTFTSPATSPEWKPAPPPPPRKLEPIVEKAEKRDSRPVAPSFGTFDSVAEDKKLGGGGMGIWIGVGVAAAVIVGGYFTYNAMSSKPSAPASQAQQQPPAQAPAPPPTDAAAQPAATPAAPAPAASSTQPASQPAPTTQGAAKPASATPPASTAKPATPAPQPQQAVERAAVTPTATRAEAPPQPVAAVPQIQVPISTAAPTLAAPKVSQSTPAQVVTQVMPKYPDMARTMKASGSVQLEASIGKDGSVKGVKVLSGHTLLRDAAAQAVRQWKYKPATLNGEPVESTVQVTVKFPEIR